MREFSVRTLQPVINFLSNLENGGRPRANTEKTYVTKIIYERALPKIFIEKDEKLLNE